MPANERALRAIIERHWAGSAARDLEKEHGIYCDDAICDYPQSGERIRGRQNIKAVPAHHPAKPSGFNVRRVIGRSDLWVSEYIIMYEGNPAYTVSIMEFRDDKVIHETQYFADSFEAPAWRAQWVERMD
jgi:ketosteroid isomerase-like protein